MGLIRRDALNEVGRWDEWCITEDASLPAFAQGRLPVGTSIERMGAA
jgi:hypothetical protein